MGQQNLILDWKIKLWLYYNKQNKISELKNWREKMRALLLSLSALLIPGKYVPVLVSLAINNAAKPQPTPKFSGLK